VAINGEDFTEENENTDFTFIGTASLFIYWPEIILIILALLALLTLIVFCSTAIKTVNQPEEVVGEYGPGRGRGRERASARGKQHVLRDDYGFFRTRGYFNSGQKSPRSSVNNRESRIAPGSIIGPPKGSGIGTSPYHI
jgi:hypothetical protein